MGVGVFKGRHQKIALKVVFLFKYGAFKLLVRRDSHKSYFVPLYPNLTVMPFLNLIMFFLFSFCKPCFADKGLLVVVFSALNLLFKLFGAVFKLFNRIAFLDFLFGAFDG